MASANALLEPGQRDLPLAESDFYKFMFCKQTLRLSSVFLYEMVTFKNCGISLFCGASRL